MTRANVASLSIAVLFAVDAVYAAPQCDCQKIVDRCSGAIEFVKSYGAKPSYGAEIVVHSSAAVCSKVEYFVDSTPYQTILVNKRSEPESLFGTSPIKESNVRYAGCYVCASANDKSSGKA